MKGKIRVAHVVYAFGTGGLEKGISTLAQKASSDIEHIIVCLATSGESERLLPPEIKLIEMHKASGNSIAFVLKLAWLFGKMKPDIVHTRNWGGMDSIIAARLAGINRVVHGEHGWGIDDPHGLKTKRVRIRRMLNPLIMEYTCVSRAIKHWLEEDIRVGKSITQIYNGVDLDVFRPCHDNANVRADLGIPGEDLVISMVGRLDPIKDHPTVLRAFQQIKGQNKDVRLLIVGGGPQRKKLEMMAGDGVHFLGNRNDVPKILQASDIFVLTPLNEGISNTILEAMATGLPVVATDAGGNSELVQDHVSGRLFAPKDVQALEKILSQYLVNRDLMHKHGMSGRYRVERDFRIEDMVHAYESLYRRVACN